MKLHFQALKVALSALKILPFRKIQIFHAAISITSTKKGCVKVDLACRRHYRISEPPDQSIPKQLQTLQLKVQLKNRWILSSYTSSLQMRHRLSSWFERQCLLTSVSLVLSRSKNKSQPNTLIFMVHLLCHSHLQGCIVGRCECMIVQKLLAVYPPD